MLNELSTIISSTLKLNKIMDRVVSESVKAINAEQGTIHLLEKIEGADPFKTFIRKADETEPKSKYRLDHELSGWMLKHRKPLLINDFKNSEIFKSQATSDTQIYSLLSAPLVCKGTLIGVLNLYNKKAQGEFDQDDQKLLSIIASQSAHVIENARLYEEEKLFRQFDQELQMAHEIQIRLLPKEKPLIEGFDVAGLSYPAKDVGGDYFDFIQLDDKRWCIALGDVSGKGIPAALLMSSLQATLRNQVLSNDNLLDCISKANNFLYLNTEGNKFVTLFCGILDLEKKKFNYVNAGHNYPLHLKANEEFKHLKTGGLVMGMIPDTAFEEGSVQLVPGETLVIFSDGVTEAENIFEEMFGEPRLQEIVIQNRELSASDLANEIYQNVKVFEKDKAQDDDITLVVVKAS